MSELTLRWPDAGLERLSAAIGRLELAGPALRERPADEVLDRLARVFDQWRDPGSAPRRALLERHPAATGLHPGNVEQGLELGLTEWSGDALRALHAAEIGALLARSGRVLAPHALTSVLLAGSIPMPSLLQCCLPLLLGSPVLARPASRDPVTAGIVAESIAAVDPELGRCIEVVHFESDDDPCLRLFLRSSCVVASGSDETIASLRAGLGPASRLVAYGHRLSIGAIGPGVDVDACAKAFAQDVALWDQLGCLSPVAIYVVAPAEDRQLARGFTGALAAALEALDATQPRGALSSEVAGDIAREWTEAEMRGAQGSEVVLHGGPGRSSSVLLDEDASWRPAPLHRFVRVHPVSDVASLRNALRPIARHLSGAAVAGFGADSGVVRLLTAMGVSRICPPGRLQAPPLDWPHDGRPVLLPLARFSDVELP